MQSARLLSSAAALALLPALPTLADVTAAEVWADWKSTMEQVGYQVQATEQQAGGVLTVTDVTMTMQMPEDGGTASLAMDRIVLTEQGDGTVAVVLPASMPIASATKTTEGQMLDLALALTQSGLSLVVSGDPGNLGYAYAADELAIAAARATLDGAAVDLRAARLAITGMAGETLTTEGAALRSSGQTITASALTWVLDITDPVENTPLRMTGQMNAPSFTSTSALPEGLDWADMAAVLASGFAVDGALTHAGGSSDTQFVADGQPSGLKTATTGGSLSFRLDKAALAYTGEATGARYEMTGGPVQLPVSVDMARAGFNLLFPVEQSAEPRDFALGVTLADVVMSDVIWAMLDPTGQLPRDPATLALDLAGKARLTADLTDPALAQATGAPGELNALTLKALTLQLAGADFSGTGDIAFDNSDTTTIPGLPRPEGAIDLRLVGGNALLDKLIAMGMVPAEQAMGVRMMMGLFGRMEGPDTLTSKIEFTPDGRILANGQQIR